MSFFNEGFREIGRSKNKAGGLFRGVEDAKSTTIYVKERKGVRSWTKTGFPHLHLQRPTDVELAGSSTQGRSREYLAFICPRKRKRVERDICFFFFFFNKTAAYSSSSSPLFYFLISPPYP